MDVDRLILITNPGSSSRKYALYKGDVFLCALHFEFEGNKIIYTLKKSDGTKNKKDTKLTNLKSVVTVLEEILTKEEYIGGLTKIDAILARVAAPGKYFSEDHIVDEECLRQLEVAKERAPLHAPVIAEEIEHLKKTFSETKIVAISDSSFHTTRPELMQAYAIDTEVAEQFDVKRWGYHGLSVGSIARYMKKQDILPEKTVVCHIGSGSSLTALFNGKSHDTTMGYTPLEGVMMATRTGSMDVAAALALKRELKMRTDDELEKYLNKQGGLLGVSGKSDDMREIIRLRDEGDKRGVFAHALYVYRLQTAIGQMVASLGGIDAIVYTATIGERSADIRRMVTQKLAYLGFMLDEEKNSGEIIERHENIATDNSKPIYVIRTDESEEMIYRVNLLLNN